MQTSATCMVALLQVFFEGREEEALGGSAKNTLVVGATALAETSRWQSCCNWWVFFASLMGSSSVANLWAATLA